MATETISFRVSTETYLKLEALASEKGTSVGIYLKNKVEGNMNQLTSDVQLMQSDLSEILSIVNEIKEQGKSENLPQNTNHIDDQEKSAIIEILMILREIAQPGKLSSAQKKVVALGMQVFKSWGK